MEKNKKLNSKKAPGSDGISDSCLKYFGKKVILFLTQNFNTCRRVVYFPSKWKYATLIMIPKARKDIRKPKNYRPIVLLNTMGKLFESLLLDSLKIVLALKIRNEQFGFRAHHSTIE